MKKIQLIFIILSFSLTACNLEPSNFTGNSSTNHEKEYTEVLASEEIRERAFRFAKLYQESETVYESGGQMPVRSAIKIDCSGLVIMCYKYAIVDTKYSLLEPDMCVSYMYDNASVLTTTPKRGDLVFMGDSKNAPITHIGIYDREENGEIYFIDSTCLGDVNGVTERHYKKGHEKIKAYGIMKLKY